MIGIYDLRNGTWIGNDKGPLALADADSKLAQYLIQMISDQLFDSDMAYIGKLELRDIPPTVYHLRDHVPTHRSPEEAMRRIEEGTS